MKCAIGSCLREAEQILYYCGSTALCNKHYKTLKELEDIKAEAPDLYEALANDDPSLIK